MRALDDDREGVGGRDRGGFRVRLRARARLTVRNRARGRGRLLA